jgi:hypothetical protein
MSGNRVKLSTPPVSASASPRNSEYEPNVTMRGGIRSRVMMSALSPPPATPTPTAASAAAPTGQPASRHSFPSTTATSPRSDPTDRSMPPVMMTGVTASANRPISTDSRPTSSAFSRVKKLVPLTAKTAISKASSPARPTACKFGAAAPASVLLSSVTGTSPHQPKN